MSLRTSTVKTKTCSTIFYQWGLLHWPQKHANSPFFLTLYLSFCKICKFFPFYLTNLLNYLKVQFHFDKLKNRLEKFRIKCMQILQYKCIIAKKKKCILKFISWASIIDNFYFVEKVISLLSRKYVYTYLFIISILNHDLLYNIFICT